MKKILKPHVKVENTESLAAENIDAGIIGQYVETEGGDAGVLICSRNASFK